jgi:hypothetical protein
MGRQLTTTTYKVYSSAASLLFFLLHCAVCFVLMFAMTYCYGWQTRISVLGVLLSFHACPRLFIQNLSV